MQRKIEDTLRDEYFTLLPQLRTLEALLKIEIQYCLRTLVSSLKSHERIVVTSRIKECESAIAALKRRLPKEEGEVRSEFNLAKTYSLKELKDLVGVRVSVFPRDPLVKKVDDLLLEKFTQWRPDPIPAFKDKEGGKKGEEGEEVILGLKYDGFLSADCDIVGEYQIVPLLTDVFWRVEHEAFYKPSVDLKGIEANLEMQLSMKEVIDALGKFEITFSQIELERKLTPIVG